MRSAEYKKSVNDLFRTLSQGIRGFASEARSWDRYAATYVPPSARALRMAQHCRETRNHFIRRMAFYRRQYLQEAA